MLTKKLHDLLLKNFAFEPTSQQYKVIDQLSEYVMDSSARGLFLLKGYAGTGKTTLVSALVKVCGQWEKRSFYCRQLVELLKCCPHTQVKKP